MRRVQTMWGGWGVGWSVSVCESLESIDKHWTLNLKLQLKPYNLFVSHNRPGNI